tara:strand:+ start:6018 stop:6224 length:207 start_codon:yes stop_codon:yes gene_type:complete
MDSKDRILYILVSGVMLLLLIIVLGDFYISLKENRPIDDSVVQILQMSITGIIGIIGGYFGMKRNEDK